MFAPRLSVSFQFSMTTTSRWIMCRRSIYNYYNVVDFHMCAPALVDRPRWLIYHVSRDFTEENNIIYKTLRHALMSMLRWQRFNIPITGLLWGEGRLEKETCKSVRSVLSERTVVKEIRYSLSADNVITCLKIFSGTHLIHATCLYLDF